LSYFKTSFKTLQAIAETGRHEDVAGFLVIARHASGQSHAGYEPYKLSGAGINGIHEKAGVSEETARGVLERLQAAGVIRPTSPETKRAYLHARWELIQGTLDLELPHLLVDSKVGVDSVLRRLRKHRIAEPSYAEKLAGLSDSEVRLDALMTLVSIYRHTSMLEFGGLSPRCVHRLWEVKSQTGKLGNQRWGAEPGQDSVYFWFMFECLRQKAGGKGGQPSEVQKARFWNAWATLKSLGLIYEAVALYDTDPGKNEQARLRCTLRVNDYHAGALSKAGDPSLLRKFEEQSGARFAFYTQAVNDREEPEAMWVLLPDKRGAVVGVWRPRFRAATRDAGLWIDAENCAIEGLATEVLALAPAD
jgi:hypothetical protein